MSQKSNTSIELPPRPQGDNRGGGGGLRLRRRRRGAWYCRHTHPCSCLTWKSFGLASTWLLTLVMRAQLTQRLGSLNWWDNGQQDLSGKQYLRSDLALVPILKKLHWVSLMKDLTLSVSKSNGMAKPGSACNTCEWSQWTPGKSSAPIFFPDPGKCGREWRSRSPHQSLAMASSGQKKALLGFLLSAALTVQLCHGQAPGRKAQTCDTVADLTIYPVCNVFSIHIRIVSLCKSLKCNYVWVVNIIGRTKGRTRYLFEALKVVLCSFGDKLPLCEQFCQRKWNNILRLEG